MNINDQQARVEAMRQRHERHKRREETESIISEYIARKRRSWKKTASRAVQNFRLSKGERRLLRLLVLKKYICPGDKGVEYSDLKSAIYTLRNKLKGESGGASFVIKPRPSGAPVKGCYYLVKPVRSQ